MGQILVLGFSLLVASSIGKAGWAVANDPASELAAGGLVLIKNDSVLVEREDLTISPTEIRVRYRMRNDAGRPVQLRVAFPMPEVPRDMPGGLATATAHNIIMPPVTEPNFLGFRVWADGREVAPELEIRALLPDGRDVTDGVLSNGGMPLLLHPGEFSKADLESNNRATMRSLLDVNTRANLESLGALDFADDVYDLRWATHITFYWMQVFRPGVTVIEHSYRPIIGGHVLDVQPNVPLDRHDKQRYCSDPSTERGIRLVTRQSRLAAVTVGYILQTAKNGYGPIGTFHLTLEGDEVSFADGPSGKVRLVSLCTDLPLRQTGPVRFEGTITDYVPAYDLLVLMLTD